MKEMTLAEKYQHVKGKHILKAIVLRNLPVACPKCGVGLMKLVPESQPYIPMHFLCSNITCYNSMNKRKFRNLFKQQHLKESND